MTKKLNPDQIAILELLYRFRFGTSTLFNQTLKPTNRQSLNSRLDILTEQAYIGKKYDKSYKLLGKPASYYLLPNGFAILRQQEGISSTVLKNMYKDKGASERFVDHCLTVFAVSNQLEALHGQRLEFFAKSELADYEHFPQPLPDGFISLKASDQPRAQTKYYFLEVFEDSTPFFAIAKKVNQYSEYADSGEWDVTGKKFPAVLAVCESVTLQKRLRKRFAGPDDFKLYTTTEAELMTIKAGSDKAWQSIDEPGIWLSLSSIMRT